jgi:2'-5' RNA ligase
MRRLFIAINLPEQVKLRITEIIKQINPEKFSDKSNFRWLSSENWHLTPIFLGYQPDEAINPILNSLKETVKNLPPPTVEFEKIIYGPLGRPARMIWLTGTKETSKTLGVIKTKLEDELIKNGVRFQRENRLYNAHLTLARFRPTPENLQLPNYQLLITFYAQSLDLMESYLKRTGAEYEILASLTFLAK